MENILYFGLTFEKFDILDFTDDFLAGVRANYFNSGCSPEHNRSTQLIGENEYYFIYSICRGKPLSWKINKNGEVYQNAEPVSDTLYRVNTYNKSGRVFKRMFFDLDHIWIKSEYYGKDSSYPEYVLYPAEIDGYPVIEKVYNSPDSRIKSYLYPKTEMPDDGDYSVLAYCDSGFVFFNAFPEGKYYTKTVISDNSSGGYGGFGFDLVDFNLERNLNTTFDITSAEYLNDDDIKPVNIDTTDFDDVENEFVEQSVETDIKYYDADSSQPDKVIGSAGESYAYYGSLNERDMRDGFGRTITIDGKTAYEGDYRDDKRDGFGVFYYKNGKINYAGNWKNNIREGFGVGFRGSDGSAHIGKWSANFPDGLGARFDSEGGFLFLGTYIDGKKQGKGITLDSDGSFVVSVFKDDEVICSYRIDDIIG